MRSLGRIILVAAAGLLAALGLLHLVALPIAYVSALGSMLDDSASAGALDRLFGLVVLVGGFALTSWGTVRAGRMVSNQVVASWQLRRWVRQQRQPVSNRLATAVRAARVSSRVIEVEADEPFAFTYGLVRPTIVVSRALPTITLDAELAAVLHHERHHARRYDPLALSLARVLAEGYFYVSLLRHGLAVLQRRQELAADRAALRGSGRAALAGAMYRVVAWPGADRHPAGAAMAAGALLDDRVTQLESGLVPRMPLPQRHLHLLRTAAGAALLAFSLLGLPHLAAHSCHLLH